MRTESPTNSHLPAGPAENQIRAGSKVEFHAVVLGMQPFQENDRLVRLLSLEAGKISALAKNAARSQKRFGAAIEPGNYVKAHLVVPRNFETTSESLWRFERADFRTGFEHFRKSYNGVENLFFVLKMVDALIPEGPMDPALFRGLGRFLRDSAEVDHRSSQGGWFRLAFWSWLAAWMGIGDISDNLKTKMEEAHRAWPEFWETHVLIAEPKTKSFFKALAKSPLPELSTNDELQVYRKWVERSGLHWDQFEKWMSAKKSQHV